MTSAELGSRSWDLDANCTWLVDRSEGKLYYVFCHECGKDKVMQACGRVARRTAEYESTDPDGIRYCIVCDTLVCYTCFVKNHEQHLRKVGYSF